MSWSRISGGILALLFLVPALPCVNLHAELIQADLAGVKPGPVRVEASSDALAAHWSDDHGQEWTATFSLKSELPLITSIAVNGRAVVQKAVPWFRCTTGRRTGGWDAFFDFPPAAPEGTQTFLQRFHPTRARVRTVGDRLEVSFDGMELGIFSGDLRYIIYPGSSLVQQVAILKTDRPDVAYTYDTGLQMAAEQDRAPGGNMASTIVYYDPDTRLQSITPPYGSERHTLQVHYRAVAAKAGAGSIVVFPPPHRYLFARDYTTNMGYAWYSSWRGKIGLGIQQPLDDNTQIYPWMNAPPGTEQEMGIFFLLGNGAPAETLDRVLAYTHKDVYARVDGYITFAPHWHFAFTDQAVAHGPAWVPPFKPELESVGLDAAMIMDFHGDGHPADTTGLRFRELAAYYEACRQQSDSHFLLIPAEEADVYLGGHWSVTFPKPVYWMMKHDPAQPFETSDPKFGKVYRVGSAEEMFKLVRAENGYVYETHPRTKGSTGYPDKILGTDYFRDPRYFGTGWKAMPSDLSSPRLGERAFKVSDDLNNLGLHKVMVSEIDVFQLSKQDELYGHMNVNYVPIGKLPGFDHYDDLLRAVFKGEGFISTGEVLLPQHAITAQGENGIQVHADVSWTFPLRVAEVVWGDGRETHTERFALESTHAFDSHSFDWSVQAPGWTWARVAVWDAAGGGAFSNPTWRTK